MASIILDSGTNRLQGDFSTATVNNRTALQTSTLNGNTGVYALPNGSGTIAGLGAANNSDPTNSSVIQMLVNGSTDTEIISGINGSGTYLPLGIYTNNTQRLSVTTTGALVLGTGTANYGTSGQVLTSSGNGVPTWSTSLGASLYYALNSAVAGANVTTAQSIFGVGVTLAGSTIYEFEIVFTLSKSAGTTSYTIAIGFGGTATLNNIGYSSSAPSVNGNQNAYNYYVNTASATVLTGAFTNASNNFTAILKGTVSVNAGGTFIPQYTLSAAPGGAYTTQIGSYAKLTPLGASGANINIGSWA
jgi:hypothetical protein